ncbi:methyltransferase domain-containing protein [Paraurantiacibacter namhicola]|uniref:Methyltransferase domain-containing protein n=1 Tax=Paraurantiacibacter namhicola TaxID=645517 RepID=A0A1C7D8D8_9SPHN|nr:methyltransferase domain-containing protein [Paraurantiacibacter namhicola]ANU07707.1 hypothetical protein A6F65_01401 [Paraurantiacibacter namhicola]
MLTERLHSDELMDDPSLDPDTYRALLADLAWVNRMTMAYRPTLAFLDRVKDTSRTLKILDVGFGDGDMLRRIARWAQDRGQKVELVGVDLNPRSKPAAEAHGGDITYVTGDYADFAGQGFDCVISSLVAHHMTHGQLVAFLRFMEAESARGWFVNDLHRHALAWLGYPLLARLARWHPIVRSDGHTSIARSYRPAEWQPLLQQAGITQARVERRFPFRLCVSRIR